MLVPFVYLDREVKSRLVWQQNSPLGSGNLLQRTSFQNIMMGYSRQKMAEGSRKLPGRPKPLQCFQVLIFVRERTQRCGKAKDGERALNTEQVPKRHRAILYCVKRVIHKNVSSLESIMPLGESIKLSRKAWW